MNSGNDPAGNKRARYQRFGARLCFGLICSLLAHGLLLSLQFGIPGLGLPGLAPPWAERRAPAPELQITLAGPKQAEEAPPPRRSEAEPAPPPRSVPPAVLRVVPPPAAAAPVRSERRKPGAKPRALARKRPAPPVLARTEASPDSFKVPPPEPAEQPAEPSVAPPVPVAAAPAPEPEPAPAEPKQADDQAAAEEESARLAKEAEAKRQDETRRLDEARRLQEARLLDEALKADALRRAAEAEAEKREEQEAARRALAMAAAQQEETRRQEQQRAERQALELEQRRKAEELARQEAAALERQKQAEQLAAQAKAEELAAKQKADEAARRKQAEQLAAQQAELAARQSAEAAAAHQREAERRAAQEWQAASAAAASKLRQAGPLSLTSGGDLASKALSQARNPDLTRSAPPAAATAPPDPERAGRRSIFGKIDNDIGLSMYIEGWRLKIERNGRLNYSQSSRDRARGDPVVTVTIRSDGSVEDIVINRSSGRPELDEAVRRIVRLNARYAAFPPALARRFDVIEIRRIWSFEDSLRILEELETR